MEDSTSHRIGFVPSMLRRVNSKLEVQLKAIEENDVRYFRQAKKREKRSLVSKFVAWLVS